MLIGRVVQGAQSSLFRKKLNFMFERTKKCKIFSPSLVAPVDCWPTLHQNDSSSAVSDTYL